MKTYNLNNLSLRDSLEITRDMWNWLADNPGRDKHEWINLFHPELDGMIHACSCCQYNRQINPEFIATYCCVGNEYTTSCLLYSLWPNGCENGVYNKWRNTDSLTVRSDYARQIANAAVVELMKLDEQDKSSKVEQPKDPYAELKAAQKAGKMVQNIDRNGNWHDGVWVFICPPSQYRIKPEPKYRPWKPEEVPVGALARSKRRAAEENNFVLSAVITGRTNQDFNRVNIYLGHGGTYTEKQMFDGYEHSLDHGKTWLPCGIPETE